MAQPGFFDIYNRYESISNLGDPLEVLDQAISRGRSFDLYRVKLCSNSKKAILVANLMTAFSCSRSFCCKASII
jgi:hypothetical protein